MSEHLLCVFCKRPFVSIIDNGDKDDREYWAYCGACQAEGPVTSTKAGAKFLFSAPNYADLPYRSLNEAMLVELCSKLLSPDMSLKYCGKSVKEEYINAAIDIVNARLIERDKKASETDDPRTNTDNAVICVKNIVERNSLTLDKDAVVIVFDASDDPNAGPGAVTYEYRNESSEFSLMALCSPSDFEPVLVEDVPEVFPTEDQSSEMPIESEVPLQECTDRPSVEFEQKPEIPADYGDLPIQEPGLYSAVGTVVPNGNPEAVKKLFGKEKENKPRPINNSYVSSSQKKYDF